ncbi:WG repeat-containing protein [Paenibacillus camelliae]|uniref:WG repeat-containing protein n=2 Tax=Paenibacillus TaxID=44249 RepID=UPI002040CA55|nr:WG repeat-containing protein [Paenibacillus camelliae]MCM3633388.1 WG repeat-containing protein [Paenibacillus camelliae]
MRKVISLWLCITVFLGIATTGGVSAQEADHYAIEPQYSYIPHYNYDFNAFNEGLAWVRLTKSGDLGVIDRSGEVLFSGYSISPYSFTTYVYSEGLSRVKDDAGKWVYVDTTGKVVLKTTYDNVLNFREGLAAVSKNGKWGFIDRTGKEIIKPQYVEVRDDDGYGIHSGTAGFYEGLAAVSKNGKWGYIDHTGKEVISLKYDWAFNFYEGLAVVSKNNKWGYINQAGKEVIPIKYDEADSFSEGLGRVLVPNKNYYHWAFLDKSGKIVLDFKNKYDFIRSFKEGIAVATYVDRQYNDGTALVDKSGKVIADLGSKYYEVKDFSEGLAYVYANHKEGFIDRTGKEVIKPIYKHVNGASNGLIGFSLDESSNSYGFMYNPIDQPSTWAQSEVKKARAMNIIPLAIDYGYQNEITRAEFSKLALRLLMVAQGQSMDELLSNSSKNNQSKLIQDTYDAEVLAAYSLGIITGKGNDKLDPQGLITRQEAAIMIARVAKSLHMPEQSKKVTFADDKSIASWAKEAVAYISSIKDTSNNSAVMSSVGNSKFAPKSTYTKQQAIISMKRLLNSYQLK